MKPTKLAHDEKIVTITHHSQGEGLSLVALTNQSRVLTYDPDGWGANRDHWLDISPEREQRYNIK